MPRAAQNAAKNAVNNENSTAGNFANTASTVNSTLQPKLTQEANNPTGYTPTDMNSMLTASAQSLGGANSGITGQANLQAARTRNSAGYGSALDEAQRAKGRQLSQNALNIQSSNANLKQDQQQAGIKGLEGLYGIDLGSMNHAMGLVPSTIDAETQAGNSGWFQNMTGFMNALAGDAKGAASMGVHV